MAHGRRTLMPIGIHMRPESVHMVQFEQTDHGMVLVSTAAEYFPEAAGVRDLPAEVTGSGVWLDFGKAREFVRGKMATDGFRGRDAAVSLPSENLVIQHLRLAPVQPDELAAALPYELQGKLPFDPRQAVVRHLVAGTVTENNETRQDVLVLATPRSVVEKLVAGVTRLGLRIVGVGAEPCAMGMSYAYAAAHSTPSQDGPPSLMIVHLDGPAVYVSIVRGQETTFVKGVEHGINRLTEAIGQTRSMSMAEAAALRASWRQNPGPEAMQEAVSAYNGIRWSLDHLIDEIESCMRYHASLARGTRVDRLYFVGPEARDRALVRVLSANLPVPCEIGDPFGSVVGTGEPSQARPEMAVAAGLSLFGAQ